MMTLTNISAVLIAVLLCINLDVHAAEFNEFERAALKAHNEHREKHGVPPLFLSRKICEWTEFWANHLATNNVWLHRPDNAFGENLYAYKMANPDPIELAERATNSWYKEIQFYDYGNPVFNKKTGHFTALVWKGTKELGIAMAISNKTGKIYVVANYNPPGNWQGLFEKNVFPAVLPPAIDVTTQSPDESTQQPDEVPNDVTLMYNFSYPGDSDEFSSFDDFSTLADEFSSSSADLSSSSIEDVYLSTTENYTPSNSADFSSFTTLRLFLSTFCVYLLLFAVFDFLL